MHNCVNGTDGHWVMIAVSLGGSYDISQNPIFVMPVTCTPNSYHSVKDLPVDTVSRLHLKGSIQGL